MRNYILSYFFEYLSSFRLNRFVLKLSFIKMLSNTPSISNMKILITTRLKVSQYGVISGSYFPASGLNTERYFPAFRLNTERYGVSLRIQSKCRKIRTRKNSIFGHFSRCACFYIIFNWLIKNVFSINNNITVFYLCSSKIKSRVSVFIIKNIK